MYEFIQLHRVKNSLHNKINKPTYLHTYYCYYYAYVNNINKYLNNNNYKYTYNRNKVRQKRNAHRLSDCLHNIIYIDNILYCI